jgi:hypothetical protein
VSEDAVSRLGRWLLVDAFVIGALVGILAGLVVKRYVRPRAPAPAAHAHCGCPSTSCTREPGGCDGCCNDPRTPDYELCDCNGNPTAGCP